MGATTILDVIGSAVVGGLILLMLLRAQSANVENLYVNGSDLVAQLNLVEVSRVLEYDFDKIGYCTDWTKMPAPTESILYADKSSIRLLSDDSLDGDMDLVSYYLGSTEELSKTPNPNDRMLYRVINGAEPIGANLGVVDFNIEYFDVMGDKLATPVAECTRIASMEISLTVQNTSGYDPYYTENDQYMNSFWKQYKLTAKNLGNR